MTTTAFRTKTPSPFYRWLGFLGDLRHKPLGLIGAILMVLMLIVAIFARYVAPYDPLSTNPMARLGPPSAAHWMGLDQLGRDVLSRVIYGARASILVGFSATVLGSSAGMIIGVVSGYFGGKLDAAVQRIMDVLLAFPILILAVVIMAVAGNSVWNVIMAIAIPFVPRTNRVIRSVVLSVKESTFVEAARAVGCKPLRILMRHVIPNCRSAFLVVSSASLGAAILVEASLSFLGLGVPPPTPSWGRNLFEATQFLTTAPWLSIFPGIAISIIVFGANLFGDALRDVWDPRLKRL